MRVGEVDTACRQRINVRCSDLRMSSKATDPVIQIIDGDEQDIQTFRLIALRLRRVSVRCRRAKQQNGHGDYLCFHRDFESGLSALLSFGSARSSTFAYPLSGQEMSFYRS